MFDASTERDFCSNALRDERISLSWRMFQSVTPQTRHLGDSLCLGCLFAGLGRLSAIDASPWGGLTFEGWGALWGAHLVATGTGLIAQKPGCRLRAVETRSLQAVTPQVLDVAKASRVQGFGEPSGV